jgi:HPt (histidine-containing phosphotransfer) domain-containing protein
MFKKETVLKLQNDVGEALAKDLMLVFINETKKLVENLLLAHEQEQSDKIILFSHSLKSSARTYGAETLACLCEKIEAAGKNENPAELNILFKQLPEISDKTLLLAINYT